ncbi:MAG: damage-inducible protein [Rhodospirillaceae bacterium]|nr:damage-inducible protein [Rhodospirillaceae bacterium]|tara:strand:+ start:1751 stop:2236 length:486 start_codon:yes stop_codon:yes gene_type:complete
MVKLTSLANRVGALLKERQETIAVSESSSGGLVSAALLSIPGASAYFIGGGIVYTSRARKVLLDIDFKDHPGVRSSSEPYALLAANAVRARLRTDWGLAETGAAGPTGNRYGDSSGHTCIAIAGISERVYTLETGSEGREENMWKFAETSLQILQETILAA